MKRTARRLRLRARRWIPHLVVAVSLLVASEILWLWQTWPLRNLLSATGGAGM
ncbi:hypothetical protein JI739_11380 [Ramlibacter sp. AW1]|uniref:Uncharacterized protein n=1 Tax=Ramlibacter aurantiacus TaxID=2801330 RepID=A0A937D1W2_9BURK|nr:hypothetical protein [Ramlibacter aurantiacus]MBL0420949.1 hypothetical protein [Ramlibacter aurantiacus]